MGRRWRIPHVTSSSCLLAASAPSHRNVISPTWPTLLLLPPPASHDRRSAGFPVRSPGRWPICRRRVTLLRLGCPRHQRNGPHEFFASSSGQAHSVGSDLGSSMSRQFEGLLVVSDIGGQLIPFADTAGQFNSAARRNRPYFTWPSLGKYPIAGSRPSLRHFPFKTDDDGRSRASFCSSARFDLIPQIPTAVTHRAPNPPITE